MHLLLHDLDVNLLHVHLLIEFGRKFGALQELGVHSGRHCGKYVSRILLQYVGKMGESINVETAKGRKDVDVELVAPDCEQQVNRR